MPTSRVRRWWEFVAIVLAIISLWPSLLGWPHPFWRVAMYAMGAVMLVLFVINVIRIRRMGRQGSADGSDSS